jgi:hypothetical protein
MLAHATSTGSIVRGLFSLLCVPVKDSAGHIIGVLQVARKARGTTSAPATPMSMPASPAGQSPTSASGRGSSSSGAVSAFSRRDVVALEVVAAQVGAKLRALPLLLFTESFLRALNHTYCVVCARNSMHCPRKGITSIRGGGGDKDTFGASGG